MALDPAAKARGKPRALNDECDDDLELSSISSRFSSLGFKVSYWKVIGNLESPRRPKNDCQEPAEIPSSYFVPVQDWLAQQLNYNDINDWYKVTRDDFLRYQGRWLLLLHGDSHYKALEALYANHTFSPWFFAKIPQNAFNSRETRVQYVSWLKGKVGVKDDSDLRVEHFLKNRGGRLINLFGGSVKWVIESLNSDFDPRMVKPRQGAEQCYWDSVETQRDHLDKVSRRLGVKKGDLSSWYNVGVSSYYAAGCRRLLNKYEGSPYRMLRAVHPEHDWLPWKFKRFSLGSVLDEEMVRKTVAFIEAQRKISKPEQWYKVSEPVLRELGVHSLILRMGGLYPLLKLYRPDFPWDERHFIGNRHFGKKLLVASLRRLWVNREILSDYVLAENAKVSFFIPSLKLCFDFQDASYYQSQAVGSTPSLLGLHEDAEKLALASEQGLSIIFVPFWWDRSLDSLVATILETDPSLEETFDNFDWQDSEPIPNTQVVEISRYWKK